MVAQIIAQSHLKSFSITSNTGYFAAGVITTFLLLTITFASLLVHLRKKDKREIIDLKQKFLVTQLNPHFIFNSLTAIQSYIFRNEPYYAGKYLANFSKLIRLVLENSRQKLVSIGKERETLNHYLDLQAFRFDGKFEYSISVNSNIDEEHVLIPPMLAQPFIENSIEHGIIHLGHKGKIDIRYILKNDNLIIEIEDNGIGINSAHGTRDEKWGKHKSLATIITQERLKNLKKIYGKVVKMEITDLSLQNNPEKQGTLIRFTLPQIIK